MHFTEKLKKTVRNWTQCLFVISDFKKYVISGVIFLFNFANDFAALSLFSVSIGIQGCAEVSEKCYKIGLKFT